MATEKEIRVDQGSRYLLRIEVKASWIADLTGYTAEMMVRAQSDSAVVLADLSAYVDPDPASQQVIVDIPDTVSSAWTFYYGVYDIEITKAGTGTARILQGNFYVDREVTR